MINPMNVKGIVNTVYYAILTRGGIKMENYINCEGEVKLYYRKDIPEGVLANVIINHGFAEHLNRYDYVTKS